MATSHTARPHLPPVSLGSVLVLAAGLLPTSLTAQVTPTTESASERIEGLVAAMTLDEKVSLLHGVRDPESLGQAGYIPGVPRLGIPPLRLSDGPAGIRVTSPATALPAPVALASTFSPELAREYGRIIGRDGRARGQDVLLAPMVNLVRVPHAGRNFETLGEDPFLAARLVEAEVAGVQEEGLIATVKHFVANNQENERHSVSAEVDDRTLHEMYLPGFEAAIRAGAGSVMASYNRVNGTYAAENARVLDDILRGEWGFDGFVVSDWGATHSMIPSLTAGMEMEMPSGRHYAGLADAVRSGELDEAFVDRAVRRILVPMERLGFLDGSEAARPVPDVPTSSDGARRIAVAGAVLLKNEGDVLPLGPEDLADLAVLGPTAAQLLVGGGGSARVRPMHRGSPLEALRGAASASSGIAYARGYDVDGDVVPTSALAPLPDAPAGQAGGGGLLRAPAGGGPAAVDATVDFTGAEALPAGTSVTWTGTLTAPVTGEYELRLQTSGGRGTLNLDSVPEERGRRSGFFGASLLPTADGFTNPALPAHLEAGTPRPIFITATAPDDAPMEIRLAWTSDASRRARMDEAVRLARDAHTAVVFAYDEGTEGRDRPDLSLPGLQDDLILAVARANPRTVVVLNNGAPVEMPWADDVAAILQMWYPGQEGAEATAALLLGRAAPGGKLPVTFPRRAGDAPTSTPERYPGVDGRGLYSEGIFVGYRWYDARDVEPLFPFGHGLSYVDFRYADLDVRPADGGFDVSFTVTNTGSRDAGEVAQVYVGAPADAPVPMAEKALAAFERLTLPAGATRSVTLHVGAREMSFWSTGEGGWILPPGEREVMVGSSSRDIRLRGRAAPGG
ncbi:MAG: glycoside hydrolase family 3 C-terminal domain-containing protein [Gemmatimonadota bacterium]|jgi:beta-glucosidase